MSKEIIRGLREKNGFSIMELSRRADISFEKARQIDKGYRIEKTSLEIKQRVADALGVSLLSAFPGELKRIKKFTETAKEEGGEMTEKEKTLSTLSLLAKELFKKNDRLEKEKSILIREIGLLQRALRINQEKADTEKQS